MEHNARRILFGRYPRTVASKLEDGQLKQHFVHSYSEMELFIDKLSDERDLYSSICRFDPTMTPILGDVAFDFDSPMKDAFWSEDIPEEEKIRQMKGDESVAESILGSVWSDVRSLVGMCVEKDIPVITVFSGMGVHCHVLYEPERNPYECKVSTSKWLIEECGLETWDRQILTDMRRVLRIPNSKRFEDGEFTGAYNIPITESEVLNNSVHDLLQRSGEPKDIEFHDRYRIENRPSFKVYDGFEEVGREDGVVEMGEDGGGVSSEWVEWIIDECIPLPCIRERFKKYNPENFIRLSGVIHLLNSGFSVREVVDIIEHIGWKDYERSITIDKVKGIYNKGYSDPSCSTLEQRGYCAYKPGIEGFTDDPSDCPTRGWSRGKAEWKERNS